MTYAKRSSGRRHIGMSWITASVVFIMAVSVSQAQLPTATILGAVRDASGSVIPGVSLTARNLETGQTRTAATALDGSYRFSALPVGSYEVRAEQAGFRSAARMGLTLSVSQEAVVNFALEVGAIEQTVEVSAEAPLVNTTSGSLGGLVDSEKLADLPLNGRNYADLILLQTGINYNVNKGTGGATLGTPFSSSGAPIYSNNYLLDGASMVTYYGGTAAGNSSTLGIDGIREYKVVTNSFSAEYGMTMGSQTTVVSKSGTNTFHGSLFEFLRNDVLDARNFFDYQTDLTPGRLPAFRRNNFGGSFGGPIVRDKTFFFGVYEGLRQRLGRSLLIRTLPAEAFNGTLVPLDQISPLTKPFLSFYPQPNLPNGEITYPYSEPMREDYGQMRVDQTLSGAGTLFGRYTVTDGTHIESEGFEQFTQSRMSRNTYITASENHILTPTLLNTFRFSFSRTTRLQDGPGLPELTGPQFSFEPGQTAGRIEIGDVNTWGLSSTQPADVQQNVFTWSDDLFYTRGRHALKFGTLINRYWQFGLRSPLARGRIDFANATTFLRGQVSQYSGTVPGSSVAHEYEYTTLGFYVQDDLRVRPNFTLNLGLRYEFHTTFQDATNTTATLRDLKHGDKTTVGPPFANPSLRNFSPRFGFAWDVRGDGQTAVRGGFGLLYDIANYGYQIRTLCAPPFCGTFNVNNPGPVTLPLVYPTVLRENGINLTQLDYNLGQPHMLQYNLTVERQLPGNLAFTLAYGGSRGINIYRQSEANANVPQILPDGRKFWPSNARRVNPNWGSITFYETGGDSWYNSLQFGFQKRMSRGLQFQSSYTWSKSINTQPGRGSGDSNNSAQNMMDPDDNQVERGLSPFDITHNWKFNSIYRLPQLADAGSVMGKLLNGWGFSGILSLQTGYPFSALVQRNLSRTGVAGGGNSRVDRPDLVAGRSFSDITSGTTAGCAGVAAGQKLGTPDLWYDPCAFTLQQPGFLGNAGRNILHGPGMANLDFSLTKDTALGFLGESGKLQFRADVFNIFNHSHFATPSQGTGGVNSAAFLFTGRTATETPLRGAGRITHTGLASRQIQLALKIVF